MTTAIVLAGGLGKRLRGVIRDVPKPMAIVENRPFVAYLLDFFISNGVNEVIFSVGYKKDIIIKYFGDRYKSIDIKYSIESIPAGTGGGLKKLLICLNQVVDVFSWQTETLF